MNAIYIETPHRPWGKNRTPNLKFYRREVYQECGDPVMWSRTSRSRGNNSRGHPFFSEQRTYRGPSFVDNVCGRGTPRNVPARILLVRQFQMLQHVHMDSGKIYILGRFTARRPREKKIPRESFGRGWEFRIGYPHGIMWVGVFVQYCHNNHLGRNTGTTLVQKWR